MATSLEQPGLSEPSFPRGTSLGRYVLLERLGAGGMGVVYAAYDPELDRKVAVKLLRARPEDPRAAAEGQSRLQREAQAMARLSHPHVVPVFDVGVVADRLFVAMELVEGCDAREWREQAPRTWQQVLSVYLQAARGLLAAHGAGLVHRDFKPENVLVGADGRVRVMDFGLARPVAEAVQAQGLPLHSRVTVDGRLLGTPAYMSPEQWRGEAADARSDQYAFCVALWEALTGELPFAPGKAEPTARPGWPSNGPRVPGSVRRALLRGLSFAPAERFDSMQDWVALLEQASSRYRRRLGVFLAVGVVGAVGVLVSAQVLREAQACTGAPARVQRVWGAPQAEQLERAFLATQEPFAAKVSSTVREALDAYSRDWSHMSTEACLATRERHEQPEPVLALRMACLERRLGELGALVEVLSRADREVVARAPTAVRSLTRLEGCADNAALLQQVPAPADAPTRARVDAVLQRLGQAKALLDAGRYVDGAALARSLELEAREVGHAPTHAEALAMLGHLAMAAGEPDAEARLLEARYAAEASRLDKVSAEVAIALSQWTWNKGEHSRAEEWFRHGEATLRRLGGDPRIEARLLTRRASMLAQTNRYSEAVELTWRAFRLLEQLHGPEDPVLADPLVLIATFIRNRQQEALVLARRALELRLGALGPDHPDVAVVWATIGQLQRDLLQHEAELEAQEKALAIIERSQDPRHPLTARAHWNMSTALYNLGELERSLLHLRRALEIFEHVYGPMHHMSAVVLLGVADIQRQLGRGAEALATGRTALARLESIQGKDHPSLIMELCGVGEMFEEQGDEQAALEHYQRSLKAAEPWGLNSKMSPPLVGIARLHLRHGRVSQARAAAERARESAEAQNGPVHTELVPSLEMLARVALAQGRLEEAEQLVRRTEENVGYPPESAEHAGHKLVLGQVRLKQSRRAEGLELLREALRLRMLRPQRVLHVAEARFALAQALGPADAEARALARQARDTYVAAGAKLLRSDVEGFLGAADSGVVRRPAPH
ncbi:serine/threonine-protein kinase [Hyalangium gracile]|uniref:serine/threonine-protein kinase n=1 Tax=Hyalangium gracile TaxID=394092 RepID=UPI001CC8F69F|nr:serine/threonine-protein kinase [Hyalangium gracile]